MLREFSRAVRPLGCGQSQATNGCLINIIKGSFHILKHRGKRTSVTRSICEQINEFISTLTRLHISHSLQISAND